ncbi:MAG: threonine/serine exporter family protein, partial [Clostridia bacterium]|nr:threonine/serine exporter family protein [Clostridia bacterium]
MTLTEKEEELLLGALLNIGEKMLLCGAEVHRVENTLQRMGTAYGAREMDVFVITSTIIVTIVFEDGREFTQSRRITSPYGTDLLCIEKLNLLSRKCCKEPMPPEVLALEADKCASSVSLPLFLIGSMLASGGFAVFFGGTLIDGAAAAVFALFVCLLQKTLAPVCPNTVSFNAIATFLTGVLICVSAHFLPVLNIEMIISGVIMLMIPGIMIT